ncbi:hypothetical protein CRG98_005804 [Punica granatum]|uniref:Uncharacterized protein n=1 Tax=Punica granatum TaxID=22663 RepID=A0A2I0KZR5_PUNGR|nr:hypothetical protein CRG98_005804 [Punica granatum]
MRNAPTTWNEQQGSTVPSDKLRKQYHPQFLLKVNPSSRGNKVCSCTVRVRDRCGRSIGVHGVSITLSSESKVHDCHGDSLVIDNTSHFTRHMTGQGAMREMAMCISSRDYNLEVPRRCRAPKSGAPGGMRGSDVYFSFEFLSARRKPTCMARPHGGNVPAHHQSERADPYNKYWLVGACGLPRWHSQSEAFTVKRKGRYRVEPLQTIKLVVKIAARGSKMRSP